MGTPFTLNWGIMATGGIAQTFVKDLLTNPVSRQVRDVSHKLSAVASSRSIDSAKNFLSKVNAPEDVKAYGSYHDLVADPNVDIVYVATPHSHHFQNAMLAIEAGKHVLCEKPFTVTAAQTRKLAETARAKKVFLMEAVWTRYLPISEKIRELVRSGAIGPVYRVIADSSFTAEAPGGKIAFEDDHRALNPELAGGALLDMGLYALTWVFQILYHCQSGMEKETPNAVSSIQKYHTGVDESSSIILQFPKNKSTGIALSSFRIDSVSDNGQSSDACVRIQGPLGEIQVAAPAHRPSRFKIVKAGKDDEVFEFPVPYDPESKIGHGMFWEADEAARCVQNGQLESQGLPVQESVMILDVMEQALKQGGVEFPELITTDVYDPMSPLNTGQR